MCGPDDLVCNGPLDPNTEYSVGYRLFTGDNSVDYQFDTVFKTGTLDVHVIMLFMC